MLSASGSGPVHPCRAGPGQADQAPDDQGRRFRDDVRLGVRVVGERGEFAVILARDRAVKIEMQRGAAEPKCGDFVHVDLAGVLIRVAGE